METQTALDLLRHDHRRAVVAILHEASPVSRSELTARLATRVVESEPGIGFPDEETRRRLRIGLHHNHLPKLAEAGAIDYDDETVAATPRLEPLVAYLDDDPRRGPPLASGGFDEHLAEFFA